MKEYSDLESFPLTISKQSFFFSFFFFFKCYMYLFSSRGTDLSWHVEVRGDLLGGSFLLSHKHLG